MILDLDKVRLDGSALSGYSKVNSGNAIELNADEFVLTCEAGVTDQPALGKDTDEDGFAEEVEVDSTGVNNRKIIIRGYLDFSKTADQTIYGYLQQLRRSTTLKALKDDYLTKYDDNPVNSTYNDLSSQDANFTANSFIYFRINTITFTRSASSQGSEPDGTKHYGNLVEYNIEGVYTQN